MNSLNSILIEGDIATEPSTITNGYKFYISFNRSYREGKETVKEASEFEVEAYGRLGEVCKRDLHIGRGVRIVGRIVQRRESEIDGGGPVYCSRVVVVAEHVEFKPAHQGAPS